MTFVPKARASGRCGFRPGAVVMRLVAGADDRVAEVHYADAGGEHAVHGRAVLMACGAVDTPRRLRFMARTIHGGSTAASMRPSVASDGTHLLWTGER